MHYNYQLPFMPYISFHTCNLSTLFIYQLSLRQLSAFVHVIYQLSIMPDISLRSCSLSALLYGRLQLPFMQLISFPLHQPLVPSMQSFSSPSYQISTSMYSCNLSAFYQASRQRLFMQFISSAVIQPSAPIHAVYSLLALPYAIHQLTLIQIFSFPKHASFQIFIASYQLSFMHFITSPLRQL